MYENLLLEYQQIQSDGPIDLQAFLSSRPQFSLEERLQVILHDLQVRWKTSQPWKVEDYLERFPEYANDPDAIVALVKIERKAQLGIDTTPEISELVQRFPHLTSNLLEQMHTIDSKSPDSKQSPKSDESPDPSITASYYPDSSKGEMLASRYRIGRLLGQGAFGRVYLAVDIELERQVAIKVPLPNRFRNSDDADTYLAEARTVAKLNHPNIVPVYDMGRTLEGAVFVVSRYIKGTTLEEKLKSNRPPVKDLVGLLMTVAEALHYAHGQRLIHRDVKPANILIEESTNTPFVADFGLAIREEDYAKQVGIAGTPTYMSPEQARGEAHRLDGRSDVFAIGVILYEALTGQRPFRGSTVNELFHQIVSVEPRPPRSLSDDIPAELERICLKALNKRASDRYASAAALAEDFAVWLQPKATQPIQSHREEQIVPKGLRTFDASDASYFLDLLPGPRNRDGLPESIAFWKQRIEQTDPEQTFSVGLIYGPSGCGKSSLVKAGLIPHLHKDIVAVYVEATPEDTEARILRSLRKRLPELSEQLGLVDTLAALRRAQNRKVVIIIDQFEQWLHAHRTESEAQLISSLRHCDGGHLQAIVMVRDDFAMAASRFMRALDTRILEGHNFATVDLFEIDHAVKVLTKFGQAFGKLPAQLDKLTAPEREFVDTVASGLAVEGKVVSVRLSLFAEMIQGKPWITATLDEVGGTQGIGVNFLEGTFSSRDANPDHRLHALAARSVLYALLPELGTDIKGHMRSQAELLEVSGYNDRPSDFNDLLRILDGELRLITPTESLNGEVRSLNEEQASLQTSNFSIHTSYFQLTHDYLVPSLREWLTRKQKETKRGRAELKLVERAAIWSEKRENKQLPSLSEWLSIRTFTDSKKWSVSEQTIMQRAGLVHGRWWGGLVLATLLLGFGIERWISAERWRNLQDQTHAVAESLQNTLGPSVPVNLKELGKLPKVLVLPELETRFASSTNPRHKLSLAFALAHYGQLDADYLASRIDDIAESDTRNYITAMQSNVPAALITVQKESAKCIDKSLLRRKARLAIVALNLGDILLASDMCTIEDRPDPEQRTLFIDEFPRWESFLKDINELVFNNDSPSFRSGICLAVGQIPIYKLFDTDKERWQSVASRWFVEKGDTTTHSAAGWLLRRWGIAEPKTPDSNKIVSQRDWFVNSVGATMLKIREYSPEATTLVDPLEKFRKQLADLSQLPAEEFVNSDSRMARAEANYQVGNIESALEDLDWLLTKVNSENVAQVLMYRTLVLARLGKTDEAEESLAKYLAQEIPRSYENYLWIQLPAWLGDYSEASRQLEFALRYPNMDVDARYNIACAASLCSKASFAKNPEQAKQFADQAIATLRELVNNEGFKNKDQLYADPDFANLHSDGRFTLLDNRIPEFWVADREVSRGQFEFFMSDASYPFEEKPEAWRTMDKSVSPLADHPAQNVSWCDSVMYCNWLSLREGRKPSYERTGTKEKDIYGEYDGWRLIPGSTGYRLLSGAEWEYACRAGTETQFPMGNDESLLVNYCQMYPSKLAAICGAKIPNAWGLHDVDGNVREWCEDLHDTTSTKRVLRGGSWFDVAASCKIAFRFAMDPTNRSSNFGFRLALSPPERVEE